MLANKINTLINNQKEQDILEIQRLRKEKDKKTLSKIETVEKIISAIQLSTTQVARGVKKLETDRKGLVRVTDMKNIFGHSLYGEFQYNRVYEQNFVEFFKELKLPISNLLEELQSWMDENGIKQILIKYEYDGGGQESWNSYWLEI